MRLSSLPAMKRGWRGAFCAATMLPLAICACSQAKSRPLSGPVEAVRILKREGYAPPTLPPAPARSTWTASFETRYGQPVAYLHKNDLYVMVARGDSHTPRVPGALWHRIGDTILIGYSLGPSGRRQFQAVVQAL